MLYQSTGTISGGTLAIIWRGKPISLDTLIDKYCKSMIERNLSNNTINAYTHVVMSVYAYLDGKIDKQGLLSWKSWMIDEKKYKASTINLYIIAFNQYLKFINHGGI